MTLLVSGVLLNLKPWIGEKERRFWEADIHPEHRYRVGVKVIRFGLRKTKPESKLKNLLGFSRLKSSNCGVFARQPVAHPLESCPDGHEIGLLRKAFVEVIEFGPPVNIVGSDGRRAEQAGIP